MAAGWSCESIFCVLCSFLGGLLFFWFKGGDFSKNMGWIFVWLRSSVWATIRSPANIWSLISACSSLSTWQGSTVSRTYSPADRMQAVLSSHSSGLEGLLQEQQGCRVEVRITVTFSEGPPDVQCVFTEDLPGGRPLQSPRKIEMDPPWSLPSGNPVRKGLGTNYSDHQLSEILGNCCIHLLIGYQLQTRLWVLRLP